MILSVLHLAPILSALDLESAIALATQSSRELMENELDIRNGHWAMASRMRNFFPRFSVAYSGSDSVISGAGDARLKRWSFSINQLIFNGGRQLADYRSASRELQIRDLRQADMRVETAFRVSLAFAEVLKNREILQIKERYAALLKDQIKLAALEYELGLLTRHELLEIRLRDREYELEIRDIRESLRESRFTLSALLSLPAGNLPVLEGSLNTEYRGSSGNQSILSADPINFPESPLTENKHSGEIMPEHLKQVQILQYRAGSRNRDLLDLGRQEADARREVQDARLSWLPRIEAEGNYSLSGTVQPDEESSFSLGLNFIFDAPLFPTNMEFQAGKSSPEERNRAFTAETDLLQNLEEVHTPSAARTRLSLIRLEKEELDRKIKHRVEGLVDSMILAIERLSIIEEKILLESEKLKIEETRLKQGDLTRLDYVDSEISLAEYKTNRIETVTELYNAEKELERLCGEFPSSRKDGLIIYPEKEE